MDYKEIKMNMKKADTLPTAWKEFCKKGRISQGKQVKSVERCFDLDRVVRGYYSDFLLDPTLPPTDAMYPSHDHITYPKDDSEIVIDARVINDMKSIINEQEFWSLIEHLYAVGRTKGKIPNREAKRHDHWKPKRDFD